MAIESAHSSAESELKQMIPHQNGVIVSCSRKTLSTAPRLLLNRRQKNRARRRSRGKDANAVCGQLRLHPKQGISLPQKATETNPVKQYALRDTVSAAALPITRTKGEDHVLVKPAGTVRLKVLQRLDN